MNVPASLPDEKSRSRRPGDIPVAEILAWIERWKVALAIAVGVVFRLAGFVSGRGYWMDEAALVLNVQELTPSGFLGPLKYSQLAPPGFLVAVWSVVRLFGDNPYSMRWVPFAGGIASLFLFQVVARRCLPTRAVFPAMWMFASANDPIYFASEMKQYSTDLTSSLAGLVAGLTIGSRPMTRASASLLAMLGAAIVWFSHPSIFTLAAVGIVGLARAVAAKDRRSAGLWCAVGIAWLASFAVVHHVATRQLGGSAMMWRFWDFAFPPMPPRSIWDATWIVRRLAYYFINPLNFDAPIGPRVSMLPAIGLACLGAVRLGTLDRTRWALLILPVAMTLLASAIRLYPFHGRLVLFLAPIPLIAIAAGLDRVLEIRGRGPLYYALATMVLVIPAAVAVKEMIEPRPIHNWLGDLHPADLDPYPFPF